MLVPQQHNEVSPTDVCQLLQLLFYECDDHALININVHFYQTKLEIIMYSGEVQST